MKFIARNAEEIQFQKLTPADLGNLVLYLASLSPETKKRFGPHNYDLNSIVEFYKDDTLSGYIALDRNRRIIAYALSKRGITAFDQPRFHSYHLSPDNFHDWTFAPSVADGWQSLGIGSALFNFIVKDVRASQGKRIILWGGVQASNEKAKNYYQKYGFKIAGEFYDNNGLNFDMVLEIR